MTSRIATIAAAVGLGLFVQPAALGAGAPIANDPRAAGWITHPAATPQARPIVLHFRRLAQLNQVPAHFPVAVTADNRFILTVNGARVAAGPSTGNVTHWRETAIDLAPYLKRGGNVISAVVWNALKLPAPLPSDATPGQRAAQAQAVFAGQTAPFLQQSIATGFRLEGSGAAKVFSTGTSGWHVKVDAGHTFANGMSQGVPGWYIAGAPEIIDASKASWDASDANVAELGWTEAVAAPAATRVLIADKLPAQSYHQVNSGRVVRGDLEGGTAFPLRPVTVPANRHVKLLIQREAMVSAYPMLQVAGGQGAKIKVTYAEALYDAKGIKADRNLIGDRIPKGIFDTFLPDGETRRFAPLWWRTWRYAEIDITTGAAPLRLEHWQVFETGYPFVQVGRFDSNDPELNRIWRIGWRTAQIDAHETYMDSAHWEQLQYVGDTRLQMLISYAVSGDPRLAEQAIDAFGQSSADGGLTQGAYPSNGDNVIATFSLLWIGMLDDWRMRQPDTAPITRNIPRMRQILNWFEPWLSPRGLLTKNPHWNFVDWVGQSAGDRSIFPSYSHNEGESCLTSAHYLGALRQGAAIETAFGDKGIARHDAALADRVAQAIRDNCWSSMRRLFADNPDKQAFSQQMNALAVLYDVVPADRAPALLDQIVAPGKGIDAPEGMYTSSYYFAWYLARAFEHAGRGGRYLDLLKTWRDLLALNYTTWPESRGNTRSDTHAWSAHPTADLLGVVAGIQPDAPGYARVRIKPALGQLTRLDAVAATPSGPVRVHYRIKDNKLTAIIDCPARLPGAFVWGGRSYSLHTGRSRFALPLTTSVK